MASFLPKPGPAQTQHFFYSQHQRIFDEIVMDSEDLQGVIIGISTALTIGPFEDAPTENLLKKRRIWLLPVSWMKIYSRR